MREHKIVRIREMRIEDAAAAAQMEAEIFSRPWTEADFRSSLALQDVYYKVAEHKETGKIVGYCGCYRSFEEGNITNMAVKSSVRRQGIADSLLDAVLECGMQMGIETFWLEVRESNEPAIRLYQKFGFEQVGIRRNFYADPPESARIMQRKESICQRR